jgi:hypothetical protein
VRFVYDPDSSFEECNGEARPLTEAEYAENSYRGCPDHPRAGSRVIDASISPNIVGCAVCGRRDYAEISYAEYLAYYGNPEKHVYLGCIVEAQCPCCSAWTAEGSSLWGIDMMTDDPALHRVAIGTLRDRVAQGEWLTPAEALALPGYLAEVARELLGEAGWKEAE